MKETFVWSILILMNISSINCLSGHVCRRQVAETYMTTYDRAFICPERYTTACGQLDWRRCTKYRVNTCYTPTEKYAVRYKITDGCCPGWKDSGNGQCSTPDCGDGCLNEGTCSPVNSVPGCICEDGFHGYRCEHETSTLNAWKIGLLVTASVVGGCLVGVAVQLYKRSNSRPSSSVRATRKEETEGLLDNNGDQELKDLHKGEQNNKVSKKERPNPSAPVLED